MKVFAMAAALAAVGRGGAAPIRSRGVWQTKKDDNGNFGHVEIKPCGAGVLRHADHGLRWTGAKRSIARTSARRSSGTWWPMRDGLYDDGKIYSPDRDKTYNGDMTLAGDSLKVRGCVLGG